MGTEGQEIDGRSQAVRELSCHSCSQDDIGKFRLRLAQGKRLVMMVSSICSREPLVSGINIHVSVPQ